VERPNREPWCGTEDGICCREVGLFPHCRSLTGDPNKETLRWLAEETTLTLSDVPSRTTVYDWNVPPGWSIREAWIKDSDGTTIVDFPDSNPHVVRTIEYVYEWC
jgi:aminopeptidase-like protein